MTSKQIVHSLAPVASIVMLFLGMYFGAKRKWLPLFAFIVAWLVFAIVMQR